MSYSDIKELFIDAKNLATGANDLQLKNILLEIQTQVYDLQEENRELRAEIHDLKNERIMESELEYRQGVYKRDNEVFCSVCWDRDKKLSRVRRVEPRTGGSTAYSCDVCNAWRLSDIPWQEEW